MSSKVIFIAGASRGIGFELAKQLSEDTDKTVIASARNIESSPLLKELAKERSNVKVVALDVASETSISELDAQLNSIAADGIDTFIFNAGIYQSLVPVLTGTRKQYLDHYFTNVLGPIEVTKVVYPYVLMKSTRQVFFVSSIAGSITNYIPMPNCAYGQSKAALNYSVKELSFELKGDNTTVLAIHPGLVLTETLLSMLSEFKEEDTPDVMKSFSPIEPRDSAAGIIKLVETVTVEQTGEFLNWKGETEAW